MQVYIPVDDGRVWARCKLRNGESYAGGKKAIVSCGPVSVDAVLPQEPMLVETSMELANVEDLCDLAHVHEASILEAIDDRTRAGKPYTAAGDVVLAVNPFRWLDGLYTRAQRKAHEQGTAKTAHAYAVSAAAARGAARGDDQSILVSGESGAGKTETVKLLLAHLADIAEHGQSTRTIVSQVLRAGPLLESFGNAATLRNGNSSRFAKFVRVEFDRGQMSMEGSWCETALLEKTRVVERARGERAFHVFYELASNDEAVRGRRFISLNTAKETKAADASAQASRGKGEEAAMTEMLGGLASVCGLDETETEALLGTVKAVLCLGDLDFKNDADDGAIVRQSSLTEAAKALSCDAEALRTGLVERDVRGATVRLDAQAAMGARDALAKELYSRVFETIVVLSNEATRTKQTSERSNNVIIGMLDLFGFEFYGTSNGFEQLLINLANERLQQRFVADVLARAQRELMAEGVPWDSIEFDDNASVLRLLEARAGLVDILNEECVRGASGNDCNFVDKLLSFHKGHSSLSTPRIRAHQPGDAQPFFISHYAGTVLYAPSGWVERNRDVLPTRLEAAMLHAAELEKSKNEFSASKLFATRGVSDGFDGGGNNRSLAKKVTVIKRGRGSCLSAAETVGSKFRAQLKALMRDIAATKCRYVRCIRPNDKALPLGKKGSFDRVAVVEQLRCCGVLSALKVARAGYPDREALPTFVERYAVCARIFSSGAVTRSSLLLKCRGTNGVILEEDDYNMDDDIVVQRHQEDDDEALVLDLALVRICAPYRTAASELVAGLEKQAAKSTTTRTAGGVMKAARGGRIKGRVFVGRTKVFLRDGALDELEQLRNAACFEYVALIQKRARGRTAFLKYVFIRKVIVKIEAFARYVLANIEFRRRARQLKAVNHIQALWRRALVRKQGSLKRGLKAALTIETKLARPKLARERLTKVRALREKGVQLDDIQGRLKALASAQPRGPRPVAPKKPKTAPKQPEEEEEKMVAEARIEVEQAHKEASATVAAARSIAADAEAALAELRLENQLLRDRCAASEARAESWRLTAARCKAREAQLVAIVDECKREARKAHELAKREKRLGAVMRDDGESASYTRLRHAMLQHDAKVTPQLRKRLLENRKPNQKVTVTQNELRDFRQGLVSKGLDVLKHSTSGKAVKRKLRLTDSGAAMYWEKTDGGSARSKRELFLLSECIEVRAAHDVDPEEKDKLVCGTKTLRRSMSSKDSKCAFSFIYSRRTIDVQLANPEDTKLTLRYCRALVREAKSKALKSILYDADTVDNIEEQASPKSSMKSPKSTKASHKLFW